MTGDIEIRSILCHHFALCKPGKNSFLIPAYFSRLEGGQDRQSLLQCFYGKNTTGKLLRSAQEYCNEAISKSLGEEYYRNNEE